MGKFLGDSDEYLDLRDILSKLKFDLKDGIKARAESDEGLSKSVEHMKSAQNHVNAMSSALGAFAIGSMCYGKARDELSDLIANLPNTVRASIKNPNNKETKKIAEEKSEMAALTTDIDKVSDDIVDFLSFTMSDSNLLWTRGERR